MGKTSEPAFHGEKLALARTFRGKTQSLLASEISTVPSLISQYELGKFTSPSDDLLDSFCISLGFAREFFLSPVVDPFTEDQCSFRRRSTTPEKVKRRVLSHATLVGIIVHYLRNFLSLPKFDVLSLSAANVGDIEVAAEQCRAHWGLGVDTPITNICRVLENAGVVVVENDADDRKIDAFSRFGDVSLVYLNRAKASGSRSLYDMAHELGHLVLHRGITSETRDQELEADRFASAFLMPRRAFAREFHAGAHLRWPHFFELKERWRTSVAAIVRRAYDLGLLNAIQYRQYYKYISMKGWRTGEPQEPEHETPEVLRLAFAQIETDIVPSTRPSEVLGIPRDTLQDILGFVVGDPEQTSPKVVSMAGRARKPKK